MTRHETSIGGEIGECLAVLRADIRALQRSDAIDQAIVEELREIVEEIETSVRTVPDRQLRFSPKLTVS